MHDHNYFRTNPNTSWEGSLGICFGLRGLWKKLPTLCEHYQQRRLEPHSWARWGCCSVACSVVSDSLWPHGLQNTRFPCPPLSPRVCSNSCPLSRWCHPAISLSVIPFSSCLQSFPASGSLPMGQLFASGGQSIGASVSTSALPVNTQDWSPLGLTSWISLLSKGLSRVFAKTTVQKHQFFSAQPFLLSTSHIHIWLLEKS